MQDIKNESKTFSLDDFDINDYRYKEIIINYTNRVIDQELYGSLGSRISDFNNKNNIRKGIFFTIIKMINNGENQLKSFIRSDTNTVPQSIAILITIGLVIIFIKISFVNALKVGNARLFLESINYKKTRLRVLEFPFREEIYYASISNILLKDVYKLLWSLTIVGGIIKHYSYLMVEYITAENPNIEAEDCIKMSRIMMNGYKWKTFLLDVSFLLWNILSILTLGIIGIIVTPYYEACKAELYRVLREDYIRNREFNYKELNDRLLFDNNNYGTYENAKIGKNKKPRILDIYELNTNYDRWDYVLFFFIFAFAGWIWEVGYFALHFGVLVNRGAMYGPWLPIYGFGCTLAILLFSKFKLLKKIQTNPLKTFFCVMVVCTILEYLTSIYLELRTGHKYWDYTGIFMNINGRVCLENSIFFGAGGCLCIYFVGPWLQKRTNLITEKTRLVICTILICLFLIDTTVSQVHPHYGDYISNDPSLERVKSIDE